MTEEYEFIEYTDLLDLISFGYESEYLNNRVIDNDESNEVMEAVQNLSSKLHYECNIESKEYDENYENQCVIEFFDYNRFFGIKDVVENHINNNKPIYRDMIVESFDEFYKNLYTNKNTKVGKYWSLSFSDAQPYRKYKSKGKERIRIEGQIIDPYESINPEGTYLANYINSFRENEIRLYDNSNVLITRLCKINDSNPNNYDYKCYEINKKRKI